MSLTKVACISDVDASDSWRASYKVVYLALCSSEWMCSVCYEGDRGVMDCVNCIILFDETKVYKIRNIIPTETLFRPIGFHFGWKSYLSCYLFDVTLITNIIQTNKALVVYNEFIKW